MKYLIRIGYTCPKLTVIVFKALSIFKHFLFISELSVYKSRLCTDNVGSLSILNFSMTFPSYVYLLHKVRNKGRRSLQAL